MKRVLIMVFELNVKVQHFCPYLDFSMQFGKKKMVHYCSTTREFLLIPGEATEAIKEEADLLFRDTENWKFIGIGNPANHTMIIIDKCRCGTGEDGSSITSMFRALEGTPIAPVTYENGWEYHKVFCSTNQELVQILNSLQKLPAYKILSIKDLGDDWLIKQSSSVSQIIEQLTEHQIEIFLMAFEKGYYDIPRKIRTLDLANELGLSRYAVDRTIRATENKIVRSLIPFFYLQKTLDKSKHIIKESNPELELIWAEFKDK